MFYKEKKQQRSVIIVPLDRSAVSRPNQVQAIFLRTALSNSNSRFDTLSSKTEQFEEWS
jgi:hypothetical protein